MPLSAAEVGAWEGLFQLRHGDKKPLRDAVRTTLVTYFRGVGTTVAEVDTSPPAGADSLKDFLDMWEDYAKAAGITDVADLGNVRRYMATPAGALAGGGQAGQAAAVADALSAAGLTLSPEQLAAVSTGIKTSMQGEAHAQCTSTTCIFLLYLGRVGTGEDLAWFEPLLADAKTASAASGGDHTTSGAAIVTVDIKGLPSYSKHHTKTSSMSLEKSLGSARAEYWDHYAAKTIDRLSSHELPHAAQRLMKLSTTRMRWRRRRRGSTKARKSS